MDIKTMGIEEMSDTSMYDQKRYDKRLIDRHLTTGLPSAHITEADLKAHLDSLPDLADKCEPVTIPQPILSHGNDKG